MRVGGGQGDCMRAWGQQTGVTMTAFCEVVRSQTISHCTRLSPAAFPVTSCRACA
ncbi:MAG: hypothetical protein U0414_32740 [Polyangiaceae bacterium]